jgi:Arc/MetJ-type ribon-helix-helix transcriptional regulator
MAIAVILGRRDCGSQGNPKGSMDGMKMSVSLPEEDVEFLDTYVRDHAAGSRSAALHEAVDLLRAAQLAGAYEDAWASWESSDDAEVWDIAVADGLSS